jgi:hypothetical protein
LTVVTICGEASWFRISKLRGLSPIAVSIQSIKDGRLATEAIHQEITATAPLQSPMKLFIDRIDVVIAGLADQMDARRISLRDAPSQNRCTRKQEK